MMLTPEQLANLRQAAKGGWKVEIDGRGIREIVAHIDAQQARIDALMLEFCPEEMTEEQRAEWARNQVPASQWPEDASDYGSRIAVIGQNGNDGISYKEQK